METNDMKAMREALEFIKLASDDYEKYGNTKAGALDVIYEKACAALATPARNCDVGTPDEQAERFENFCLKHIGCAEETGGRHCVGCPLEKASRNTTQKCELYWAQIPYVEKEGDSNADE